MRNLPISCWAKEDIPTNKAEDLGFNALSDVELLSIIIGSGSVHSNSIDLARELLYHCNNNLKNLSKLTEHDLLRMKGLGKTKLARIMAAMELGTRAHDASRDERVHLSTATQIYRHYHHRMMDLDVEEFWVTFCNQDYKVIKDVRISRGGFTDTAVDIRLIMREAVLANATICFAVHNHPSGNLCPSRADEELTKTIARACEIMRIYFADHVIITDGAYYSFREVGKI